MNRLRDSNAFCISLFRRSNENVRTSPSPQYFKQTPPSLNIKDLGVGTDQVKEAVQLVSGFDQRYQNLFSAATKTKQKIHQKQEKALKNGSAFLEKLRNESIAEDESIQFSELNETDRQSPLPFTLIKNSSGKGV